MFFRPILGFRHRVLQRSKPCRLHGKYKQKHKESFAFLPYIPARIGRGFTAVSLKVSKGTVISAIARQEDQLVPVNPNLRQLLAEEDGMTAKILPACEKAELDEQWSFVGNKSNQRWLWYAVDHKTNTVLAYVFGRRKDEVFRKLK